MPSLPDGLVAVAGVGPFPFCSVEPSVFRAINTGGNAFISKLMCVCVCVCVVCLDLHR